MWHKSITALGNGFDSINHYFDKKFHVFVKHLWIKLDIKDFLLIGLFSLFKDKGFFIFEACHVSPPQQWPG